MNNDTSHQHNDGDEEDGTFIPDANQCRGLRPRRLRPVRKLKDSPTDMDEYEDEDEDEDDEQLPDQASGWKTADDVDEEDEEEKHDIRKKKKKTKRSISSERSIGIKTKTDLNEGAEGAGKVKQGKRLKKQTSASAVSTDNAFLTPEPVSDEQLKQAQQSFQLFDQNETGRILRTNVELAMNAIGLSCANILGGGGDGSDEDDQKQEFPRSKTRRRNQVSLQEFEQLALDQMKKESLDREIRRVFRLLDKNGDGRLSLRDLRKVTKELELGMTKEELQEMIDEVDEDRDGEVGHEDFVCILLKTGLMTSS